jgi:hypothetical protein
MRGNSARECRTSLISPKNSTPESNPSLSQTRQPPRAAADGAASTKVDARRNAPTARFPIASPFPGGTPARRDVNRQPLPLSNPPTTACRSGRGSVHEGGRPAERPHGAISNRQPLPRRNARAARCQSPAPLPSHSPTTARRSGRGSVHEGGRPAERLHGAMSIASPFPGGTPARCDVNRQPLPLSNPPTTACHSGRGSVHEGGRPAERLHGAMSIASPSPHRGGFFGKPLYAISRFSHQNAQTPPSPRVGEGGRGDEGQTRTGMQKITDLSQEIYP